MINSGAEAVAFAKEGADIAIVYVNEHEDAEEVKRDVEQAGRTACLSIATLEKNRYVTMLWNRP